MPPKRKAKTGAQDDAANVSGALKAESTTSNTLLLVPSPSTITPQDIDAVLSRYSAHIQQLASKPESKLCELDDWRLNEVSALVRARNLAYLDKEELQKLMEWKLTRGKFRPTLPALIAQNTPQKVKSSTQEAFSELSQLKLDPKNDKGPTDETCKTFRALVKKLCAGLKGVGPATGSLVLSIHDEQVPFMSDEAYIWAMYADDEASSGKKKLKREVKYTEKGYLDFAVRMWEIAAAVNRTPAEMERVGWVLGREWISGGSSKRAGQNSNTENPVASTEMTQGEDKARKSKRQKR